MLYNIYRMNSIIKKPVKKPVNKPVKKPVNKPVSKPVKKPVKKPVTRGGYLYMNKQLLDLLDANFYIYNNNLKDKYKEKFEEINTEFNSIIEDTKLFEKIYDELSKIDNDVRKTVNILNNQLYIITDFQKKLMEFLNKHNFLKIFYRRKQVKDKNIFIYNPIDIANISILNRDIDNYKGRLYKDAIINDERLLHKEYENDDNKYKPIDIHNIKKLSYYTINHTHFKYIIKLLKNYVDYSKKNYLNTGIDTYLNKIFPLFYIKSNEIKFNNYYLLITLEISDLIKHYIIEYLFFIHSQYENHDEELKQKINKIIKENINNVTITEHNIYTKHISEKMVVYLPDSKENYWFLYTKKTDPNLNINLKKISTGIRRAFATLKEIITFRGIINPFGAVKRAAKKDYYNDNKFNPLYKHNEHLKQAKNKI